MRKPQGTQRALKAAGSEPATGLFGHSFREPALLERALTHRSLVYETEHEAVADPTRDNEQLEFLGDAVLGLVVAESLLRRYPGSPEGELTRLRASLVSRKHLAEVAERIALGRLLLLGRGEEQSGGRRKPALLANAMEAVIAALYLDGGLGVAAGFIEREIVEPSLPELDTALGEGGTFSGAVGDHKSALQELLQATGAGQPQYVLVEESGPDHRKLFCVEVHVGEGGGGAANPLSRATGASKKLAQQEAARLAFARLREVGQASGGTEQGAADTAS